MNKSTNVSLLKEYIKTLVATEVEFPGILPRSWGNEFSRTELMAIYFTLKFILQSANAKTQASLMKAFKSVNDPGMNMHWFLCDFSSEIIPLLTKHNTSDIQYPSAKSKKTLQGLDLAVATLINGATLSDMSA